MISGSQEPLAVFCAIDRVEVDFANVLGQYTPCFTDIVVLGSAHAVAIILCLVRLAKLTQRRHARYGLLGASGALQVAAAALSTLCLLAVLFQLNARIAAGGLALVSGPTAPFEFCSAALAAAAWLLFAVLFAIEARGYCVYQTWLWRFPIFLTVAAELAKLRFVVQLAHDYFYYLFLVSVGAQIALALIAALHFPPTEAMQLLDEGADPAANGYLHLAEESEQVCPEAGAGLWSLLTFSWMDSLMRAGYAAPLQFSDIWQLPPADRVECLDQKFRWEWGRQLVQQRRKKPSLAVACWRSARSHMLAALPFKLVNDTSQFAGPFFLNLLLTAAAAVDPGAYSKGYLYATLMLAGLLTGSIADNQQFQRTMRAGFQLRSVLTNAVFRKLLFLSPSARATYSSGRLYSAVGADVDAVQQLCQNLLGLISSPLRIVVAVVMLYLQLGVAAFAAVALLVLLIPVQAVMVRFSSANTKQALRYADERGKLESELLGGIDVVKCFAWGGSFLSRVGEVRSTELRWLWRAFLVSSVNTSVVLAVPVLAAVGTFASYVLITGKSLTAAQAFTSLTLLGILRFPLFQLPALINALVNASVATDRLQQVLLAEEQPPLAPLPPAADGQVALRVSGEFSWAAELAPALVDIDLAATAGQLVAVVGATGSGKTSLLSAALGLLVQVAGPAPELHGHVAFVPQQAFIVNDTVRANILFGQAWDEARYWAAVQAAQLSRDLQQLAAGDLTELGSSGVNVSGGQKQRIALARAVYSNADIVLLDDPLSALDAKVGRRVFADCIGGALSGRTRVLATNQLQFVRHVDVVAYLEGGCITEKGTYDELIAKGGGFAQLMAQTETAEVEDEIATVLSTPLGGDEARSLQRFGKFEGGADEAGTVAQQAQQVQGAERPPALSSTAAVGQARLTTEETRSTGGVAWGVVMAYISAMGGVSVGLILLVTFAAVEVARVSAQLFLQSWTADADSGRAAHSVWHYLAGYSLLSASQVALQLTSQFAAKSASLRASSTMHMGMLSRLLLAPMSFFHTTPHGRVVNRLTKDTADVDRNLMDFSAFYTRSLMQLTSTVCLIALLNPFSLWALTPVLLAFYFLYAYFQSTVREVKRLDAISRSPLYSAVGDAIGGTSTIRAYGAEGRLVERMSALLDANVVMSLVNQSANRWLSVRLEALGAVAAFAAAALAVEQRGAAAVLGNIVSTALQLTALTSMTVRAASLAETSFNAVERVEEMRHVGQEAAAVVPGSTPPGWPQNGGVTFADVRMRYRPGLPLVLKGLSADIPGGTSCGIVGRTGAGKSSLINCLFRLNEIDCGSITIDGVNIARIGVDQVRSAMAFIPQTPVLFTGTVRFNLDPWGACSDAELWAALRRAHLAPVVVSNPLGLSMAVSEGGVPFSAGQKQLVALARALLRRSKVLVCDEATSNIDLETDALIQRTVRTEFAGCTVISIAHRLHTIIDADNVLVMAGGRAAEFGPAAQLLSKPHGVFTDMVRETGAATERMLRALAQGEQELLQDAWARAAARGRQQAQAPPSPRCMHTSMVHLSKDILSAATSAADALRAGLEALAEIREAEEEQEQGAGSRRDGDAAAATAELHKALKMLEGVQRLAAGVGGGDGVGVASPAAWGPRGERGEAARWETIRSRTLGGSQLTSKRLSMEDPSVASHPALH